MIKSTKRFSFALLSMILSLLIVTAAHPQEQKTQPAPGSQDTAIHLHTQVVNIPVTVTDVHGRYVTALEKQNFTVYEDKLKQQIDYFSEIDAPVSIGIVFDISGSMKSRIGNAQAALRKMMDSSNKDDDYFLITFASNAQLVKDFTSDGESITNALSFVTPKGSTALYDGAYLAVEKVRQGRHKRRAILIISDGEDNNSRYSYRELSKLIKEADVQIYGLGITDFAGPGMGVLEQISRTTGGRAFSVLGGMDLEDAVNRIALELRHQYSLGYVSANANMNGQFRKIRVEVTPVKGLGKLVVRARDGYFAEKSVEIIDK
ncbi:MAG TPA: VWA domain-containing protein [Blastocatellia bacterium]|nr:VWA domain-containing protein [Blastocatellia bacterium]